MTCPNCGRTMPDTTPAEMLVLRAEIDRLTPKWRDGEPPKGEWILREGVGYPIYVMTSGEWTDGIDEPRLWNGARWCPIVRPA